MSMTCNIQNTNVKLDPKESAFNWKIEHWGSYLDKANVNKIIIFLYILYFKT